MKTSVEDDSIVPSRLYFIQRWLKKIPSSNLKRKALYSFREFMKSYNLRYHNLPKTFPSDFSFERSVHTFNREMKTSSSFMLKNDEVKCLKKTFKLRKNGGNQIAIYELLDEHAGSAKIPEADRKLYSLLREIGFLHFELDQIDVSFDSHSTSSYQLSAHGKCYTFVNATESPIQPMWEQNCEKLDRFLNELANYCAPERSNH